MKYIIYLSIFLIIVLSLIKNCYICVGLSIGVYMLLYIIETNDKAKEIIKKLF
ncbi:hypothetical protein [Caminibacter mediatlanticus]|uniref:Uncharacterized protein n=1 Tax=Caminibacter mediatlanticus TB-2 TaxID=391592 RepID=A0AAI9F1N9_9BACT|nr:hypothetical protein [Caminibacter mediatlanticus]EDM22910.1 hypothetical protein CMTB2_05462 [Caminibacter mediatlanticus TB-2]